MKSFTIGVLLLLSISASASPVSWFLEYKGKSANDLVWDKRFKKTLSEIIPKLILKDLSGNLVGPPRPIEVISERYFSTAACRAHSCTDKGFLWVDTETGSAMGAVFDNSVVTLASKSFREKDLPAEFKTALVKWVRSEELVVKKIWFMGARGPKQPIELPEILNLVFWKPSEGGPGFDCLKATTTIEKTICSEPEIAKADLTMFTLYRDVFNGHSDLPALEELKDSQEKWLKKRDSSCVTPAELKACLLNLYSARTQELRKWVPGKRRVDPRIK